MTVLQPTDAEIVPGAQLPSMPQGRFATLKVHYHRWDGRYREATLWTWDATHRRTPQPQEVVAAGRDAFGVFFLVDVSRYGQGALDERAIGMIPRLEKSWDHKDGSDRQWNPRMGFEVWLIQGEDAVHLEAPDISPRVAGAWLDSWTTVRALLSHPVEASAVEPADFRVVRNSAEVYAAERVVALDEDSRGKARLVRVDLAKPLRSLVEYAELEVDGYRPAPIGPGLVQRDEESFGTALRLGAIWSPERTVFRYFSPAAAEMAVSLYAGRDDAEPAHRLRLAPKEGGVWEGNAAGDCAGMHYSISIRTAQGAASGEFADPHAVNTVGHDRRTRIANLRATDPEGFRPIVRPALPDHAVDAIITEVSVRDFTIDEASGVKLRGKYLGLAERGTRLVQDRSVATGLDHLRELGATHVQILPCEDFDNDEESPDYNWGYMTAFFNSPEGWYATDIRGDARIREFKQMVKALHEAGLGVVMDVVYNHTGVQNTLEKIAPGYFLRRRPDGRPWNGSGTGNEVASEAPMMRRFIVESCRHWMEEYGVDGFRFDLMGLIDVDTMLAVRDDLRRVDPRVVLYGEPWGAAENGLGRITDKHAVAGTGIGAFNDSFRNAIKGEPDGHKAGYVQNGSRRRETMLGIAGSIEDWAKEPGDSINYVTCHDNLTLWDKLAISTKESEAARERMHRLAVAILAVSQGTMFLHGGCEFLRTKGGNHNSYDAGDAVNRIDWDLKRRHRETFDYVRGLIALRRAHPAFRLRTTEEILARLRFHEPEGHHGHGIVFTIDAEGLPGEPWRRVAVLINPDGSARAFRNPLGEGGRPWVYDSFASTEPLDFPAAAAKMTVPPRSLSIYAV